jgi:anti-sigma factor RsiW
MDEATPITEADLHAFADGRLAAARRAEVEAWLAARPEDAERVASYRETAVQLRAHYDSILSEAVPEKLERAATGRRRTRWRAVALAAGWTVFGAALGALAAWQMASIRPVQVVLPDTSGIARRAAVAHAVYSPEVRHPVEVGADQEQHLVTWLSKRLGLKLKAPQLDEAGMSLVGGRLLPGEAGPVAQFMYQSERGRRMTLYVRAENAPHRETAFRYARENNVGVFYWIEQTCSYAIASSDLSKEELLAVANMVYKQLEP